MGKKFLIFLLFFALLACSCGRKAQWHHEQGVVWGTTYSIKYEGQVDLTDSIQEQLRAVDSHLSMFNAASDVSRLNRGETLAPDTMLRQVLACARQVHAASGGTFDPTIGPLVNLWGFGTRNNRENAQAPAQTAIDSALTLVGLDNVVAGPKGTLRLALPGMTLDLSAIAKGYGIDCVARMFRRNGVENYMIEIGGEVACLGLNPEGKKWRIAIDRPDVEGYDHDQLQVIDMTASNVATSGNYRNKRLLADGSVASHTLSPHTGRPVQTQTLSVTVAAPTCMLADALATACMAMPYPQAREMIESQPDVFALFVLSPNIPGGQYRLEMTGPWPK